MDNKIKQIQEDIAYQETILKKYLQKNLWKSATRKKCFIAGMKHALLILTDQAIYEQN